MTGGVSIHAIAETVAEAYGVEMPALVGMTRRKTPTEARQVAMYLACKLTSATNRMVGRVLGDRDHTTVMHAERVIGRRIVTDQALAERVAGIERGLQALAGTGGEAGTIEPAIPHRPRVVRERRPAPPARIKPPHTGVLTMLGRYLDSREALRRSEFTRQEATCRRQVEADFKSLASAWNAYRAGEQA